MTDPGSRHFTGGKALAYDRARAPLAPIYAALYVSTSAVLSPAGESARVLCVGAGTGDELVALASRHPGWSFTVVEPSADMMALCREKARAEGIERRCEFVEGTIDLAPEAEDHDAATCLMVSYFLLDPVERTRLFAAIAARLRAGGLLVNAELSPGLTSPEFPMMRDAWVAMHRAAGIDMKPDYLGRDVAVSSSDEVEAMLVRAGFSDPVRFSQALLISAWCSRRR